MSLQIVFSPAGLAGIWWARRSILNLVCPLTPREDGEWIWIRSYN